MCEETKILKLKFKLWKAQIKFVKKKPQKTGHINTENTDCDIGV